MSDQLDWNLLDRYFGGEATPQEVVAVQRWMAGVPGHAEELEAARKIWETAGTARPRFDVRAAKAAIHRKMVEPAREAPQRQLPRFTAFGRTQRIWALAASIAALLVGATVWRAGLPSSEAREFAAGVEYQTSPGERSQFYLPDGTQVTLGPASRLTLASAYGVSAREARLEGEGYFNVVHDGRRPFAIQTRGAVVRDLGTRFDVRAYAEDRSVRVVVAEGRVALDRQPLSPGQMATRAAGGAVAVHDHVDVERYLAWTQGYLVFDEMPLSEAIPELSRWYNLPFALADSSLARLPLSGRLRDRLSAETLDLLALSLGVPVARRGNTVVIGAARS